LAFDPANAVGPAMGLPLLRSLIPLIPLAVPVPLSETVKLVKFTAMAPRLVNTTESTGTLEAPGNWVVLDGAGKPAENCTMSGVGVRLGVDVGE
jgi:hypothetical protein